MNASEVSVAPVMVQALPGTRAGALAHWLGAFCAYAAVAVAITWPLGAQLFGHLPVGLLGEPTVPYFNLWTLEWNVAQLQRGYPQYWDAPLFYPARDAFALSEPQGLTALWFAPLARLCGVVAGYNLTLLGLLVMNGLAGRRLLRVLGVGSWAASLGGTLFVGLPLVCRELGVLQLCAAWPVVLGLGEIAILMRGPAPWAVVRLGLWMAACAWSCIYYALFFGVFVLLTAALCAQRRYLTRPMFGAAVAALALAVASVSPLLAAERRAVSGYKRSADTIHSGSGSALAYLHFPQGSPLARAIPRWARPGTRRSLYPGLIPLVLAGFGIAHARRLGLRRWLYFSAGCGGLALWFSFGTRLHLGDVTPYQLTAQRYLPGFGQLRSPYRAALFVQLIVVALAGLGLAAWLEVLARHRSGWLRGLPLLCVGLALYEVGPHLATTERFPHEVLHEPWVAWLTQQPDGPVAMIPPNKSGRARDYADTVLGMLQANRHGHPLVNGYSGFFPPETDRLISLLRQFPNVASLRALKRTGVRYIVVDGRWPGARGLEQAAGLSRVFEGGRRSVYQLTR